MPLDEKSLRRPEFAGGVPIRLADGQEWTLPKPILGREPVFGDDGRVVGMVRRRSFGPDYDAMLEAFLSADSGEPELLALFDLAADLLRRNYALSPADCAPLLLYRDEDEGNRAAFQKIADVATGINRNPPSPIGDESN